MRWAKWRKGTLESTPTVNRLRSALVSVALAGLVCPQPAAAGVIRQCADGSGGVVLTDAEACPSGTREERVVSFESSPSRPQAGSTRQPTPAAQARIRDAKVAACADLDERHRDLQARLSQGGDGEPAEASLTRKEQSIEADRCRLGCQSC